MSNDAIWLDQYGWQVPPWCPIPGCTSLRRGEMCKRHWTLVAADLQREVWRTWKSWRTDFANAQLMKDYRNAVNAARCSVEPRS